MRQISPNANLEDVIRAVRALAQDLDSVRNGAFTIRGDLSMNGHRLRGLGKPIDSADAQTKIKDLSGEFAPLGASYVVAGNLDVTLTHERLLAAGDGIEITDNGAGSTVAVAADQAFFDALYQPLCANLTELCALDLTMQAGNVIAVNVTEDGFEFVAPGAGSGIGDVVGPASSTDNAAARFDLTTGKLLQNGVVLIGDLGEVTGVRSLAATTSGTGSLLVQEWASSSSYMAAGLAGVVGAGTYNLMSSPGDTNLYINAPTSREIRLRINNATIAALDATGFLPGTAGALNFGAAGNGIGSIFVDSASTSNTLELTKPTIASNIQVAWPASAGTLALTSDIAATVDQAFVNALNVDADTLDGLDSTAFQAAGSYSAAFTDSAGLRGLLSDENGTGAALFDGATSPTFAGTIVGSVSGNAATVTTNANLTGPITSVGNATAVGAQTGTGSTFVMDTSPTLVTPVLGVATGTSLALTGGLGLALAQELAFNGLGVGFRIRQDAFARLMVKGTGGIDAFGFTNSAFFPAFNGALGTVTSGFGSLFLDEAGAGTQTAQIIAPTLAADIVLTTPAATGTLATLAGTENFTNKTYNGSSLNLTLGGTELALPTGGVAMFSNNTGAADAVVGINAAAKSRLRGYTGGVAGPELYFTGTGSAGVIQFDIDSVTPGSAPSLVINGGGDEFAFYDAAGNQVFDAKGTGSTPGISQYGKTLTYNNIATVSNGVPSIHAEVNITARTSAITAGTLYTPPTDGLYRVSFAITLTTAGTVSSVVGAGVNLNYTSGDGSVAKVQNVPMNLAGVTTATTDSGDTSNTVGTTLVGWTTVYADTAAMTYDVGYTSVGATAMQYAARVRVERL